MISQPWSDMLVICLSMACMLGNDLCRWYLLPRPSPFVRKRLHVHPVPLAPFSWRHFLSGKSARPSSPRGGSAFAAIKDGCLSFNTENQTHDSSARYRRLSANEMRSYYTEKLTRTDDLGILPELGKVALVACHQVVCASSVSAFNEDVVSGIRGDLS